MAPPGGGGGGEGSALSKTYSDSILLARAPPPPVASEMASGGPRRVVVDIVSLGMVKRALRARCMSEFGAFYVFMKVVWNIACPFNTLSMQTHSRL